MRFLTPVLLASLLVATLTAGAEELNVAVAANFYGTTQILAPKFEQATGNKLALSSGSSGQFYTQIKQGAPFDVLLSADTERPKLSEGRFKMLGIADPHLAPYGAAAQQVLTNLGLWDKLNQDKKLATGEIINQAWQFAVSGNVDMAFVALSQVTDGKSIAGSYWLPPQSLYKPLEQDAVVLTRTTKRATAEAFMKWLRQDSEAIATIKTAGYRIKE